MTRESSNIKQSLLESAGELFAESGLNGVSIRTIAETVGANIASVNYYFGSKENLYRESLRHVLRQCCCPLAKSLLEDGVDFSSLKIKQETIRGLVRERCQIYLSDSRPEWYGRLFMRAMLMPREELNETLEQLLEDEHQSLIGVLQRIKPSLEREEAELWANTLTGQIAFYVFSEAPILILMKMDSYSKDFIAKLEEHISQSIIAGLELS